MLALGFCHVRTAGAADLKAVLLPTFAKDNQRTRKRFGDMNASNRFGFGFGICTEAFEEWAGRVEPTRAAMGFFGLPKERCDKTKFGY